MYYQRTEEQLLERVKKDFACIAIYGPRQCGKSTMVHRIFQSGYHYVTLDDTEELLLAKNNPKLFLDNHPWPVVIDEIQKAPNLLSEIKVIIDKEKMKWVMEDKPHSLMYILTGSNQYVLKNSISESLAGRVGIMELNSFSLAEKKGKSGSLFIPDIDIFREKEGEGKYPSYTRNAIFDEIFEGGFPEYVLCHIDRETFFKSYLETYLTKDVRLLISGDSETTFRSFLSYVALRTGQEIAYDSLASAVGIDVKTVKRWLSILESCGLIAFLEPFMKNESNRIIKVPKLYFMDTGLAAYLCGWPSAAMLEKSAMAGAFFENFVVSELIKNHQFHGKDYKNTLFYYRDIDKKEIDVIYYQNGRITPIEIKKGINPSKPNKNFKVLDKFQFPIQTGFVIDCTDRIRPINEQVYTIPISLIEG